MALRTGLVLANVFSCFNFSIYPQKRYANVLPFKAGDKGWGLKAEEDLDEP